MVKKSDLASKEKRVLPERLFYRLSQAAEILECSEDDVIHYAVTSALKLSVYFEESHDDFLPLYMNSYDPEVYSVEMKDKWYVGGISPNRNRSDVIVRNVYRFKEVRGFFYIAARDLFAVEFGLNTDTFETAFLSTHPENLSEEREGFYITSPTGFITVKRRNLCVMADDLAHLNTKSRMPLLSPSTHLEAPKTIALKRKLAANLIELLPIFKEGDIEQLKTAEIYRKIEDYAAKERKTFYPFDKEVFANYIGKKEK